MTSVRYLAALFLTCFAPSCLAQYAPNAPLSRETILLARVRAVASENARRIPNFTCGMTVDRSLRRPRTGRFERDDVLRLEVAYADGKEMFAWPGARRFAETDITALVGTGGAIGTGDFTSHVQSVLLSDSPRIEYAGEESLNGHQCHRFRYQVARARSRYFMRIPPIEENVGYRGSFWVDRNSMDLVRLEIEVDEIPSTLPMSYSRKVIDLERQKIGDVDFLLPVTSELEIHMNDGSASLNLTRFTDCHQFLGESSISFEDPAPESAAPPASITLTLPPGLKLDLALSRPIDLKQAARGDQVFFRARKDASTRDGVLVPKDAEILGRVDMIECMDLFMPMCFLMLHLESFQFANKSGQIRAALEAPSLELPGAVAPGLTRSRQRAAISEQIVRHPPDRGVLPVRGGRQTLKPGFQMIWRVLPDPPPPSPPATKLH